MKKRNMHITVVLDRSGSMHGIKDDVIGGFNSFLAAQQREGPDATLTLVQFDTENPYEVVHRFRPIHAVPPLTAADFIPRGGTPLLDAMGRTLRNLSDWLTGTAPGKRPGKIVVVFITDGQENSSREFRLTQIKTMIRKQQKAGWQIVFLSSDLDAVKDALSSGFRRQAVMAFSNKEGGARIMFDRLSSCVCTMRSRDVEDFAFTEADREQERLRYRHKQA